MSQVVENEPAGSTRSTDRSQGCESQVPAIACSQLGAHGGFGHEIAPEPSRRNAGSGVWTYTLMKMAPADWVEDPQLDRAAAWLRAGVVTRLARIDDARLGAGLASGVGGMRRSALSKLPLQRSFHESLHSSRRCWGRRAVVVAGSGQPVEKVTSATRSASADTSRGPGALPCTDPINLAGMRYRSSAQRTGRSAARVASVAGRLVRCNAPLGSSRIARRDANASGQRLSAHVVSSREAKRGQSSAHTLSKFAATSGESSVDSLQSSLASTR